MQTVESVFKGKRKKPKISNLINYGLGLHNQKGHDEKSPLAKNQPVSANNLVRRYKQWFVLVTPYKSF